MKIRLNVILMAAAVVIMMTSCAKFPEAEVQTAKDEVEKARTAGAELYLPEQFAALQDSLNATVQSLETQKSKWFPNYDNNVAQMTTIGTTANELIVKTEERKVEIREEIQTSLAQIQTLLTENNELIAQAPKGKEGAAALVQIKEELAVVQTSADEAAKMLESGELIQTKDKVSIAQEKATAINTELKDVIAKYGKGKKS
ncbi:MAG: hypothetical protein HC819_17255 [Cyclobacteriaceae bacterium]|nr:hypothetical protein [Cyclobacteriaceae bacterium]